MINPISNGNININEYSSVKNKADEAKQGAFEKELDKALAEKDEKKLRKVCSDLESVFINMMFKQMRSTIQKSDLMGGGMAQEMYEDMLYESYAEEIAKGKGIGIGDLLYKQLAKSINRESE
jgi:flagellar protein FlgJ